MRKRHYKIGERVILKNKRERLGARVTGIDRCKRRIITDLGERKLVNVRDLTYPRNETFLMLETRLDRSLRSDRGQGGFIYELVTTYGIRLLYERVHNRESLAHFLAAEGRNPSVRLIHFSGHGHGKAGTISLTFEDLVLEDSLDLFMGLKGKLILFSSCEIGRLEKTMSRIVKEAQLAGIIAYRAEVTDTFANLAETMIYHRLILSSDSPRKIVKDVNSALKALGAKCVDKTLRGPALACFS